MNEEQFKKVTEAFLERLSDLISNAGCNDLYEPEFSNDICEEYGSDSYLFDEWKKMLYGKMKWEGFERDFGDPEDE